MRVYCTTFTELSNCSVENINPILRILQKYRIELENYINRTQSMRASNYLCFIPLTIRVVVSRHILMTTLI